MIRCTGAVLAISIGLASAAQAGGHMTSGTYVGRQGDTGTWDRSVTSTGGTFERQGSWSGANGSGSYGGVGTHNGGSGSFNGTFSRNGGPVGTIHTVTTSTGNGHMTTGQRTKGNGVTHNLVRTRTLTPNGYVISGVSTGADGVQRNRQTVDTGGVAVTTITRPDGSSFTSTRTGRSQGR